VALIVFVVRQHRSKEPFLDLRPFTNFAFVLALVGSMLLYAVMMAGSLILPIYLQTLRGYSSTASGLITLPGSLVMIAFSPIAGRLYDRFGIRPILIVGSIALFASCIGLSFVSSTTAIWYIVVVYMFRMLAVAMLMMPLVSWGMSVLDDERATHGSALISSLRTFAGAISMVTMTSLMTGVGQGHVSIAGVNAVFITLSVLAALMIVLAIVQSVAHSALSH
jgi:MFS family permease